MLLQRYALTFPVGARVPFCCFCKTSRWAVWATGMLTYQLSQFVYQFSLVLAPLTLTSTMFTLMLMWNVVLSRKLLGERPSRTRVTGTVIIVIGAVISVFGVPPNACNVFTIELVDELFFNRPIGGTFAFLLLLAMIGFTAVVVGYDCMFSIPDPPPPLSLNSSRQPSRQASQQPQQQPPPKRPPRTPRREKPPPPKWLDRFMVLLAPVAVALQEGFGSIIAKSLASIVWNQVIFNTSGGSASVNTPFFYVLWVVVVVLTVTSAAFLKVVYGRYEASTALPIEYGTVHFAQILAGVLFFEEYKAMAVEQFLLAALGLSVVLFGVGLSSEVHRRQAGSGPAAAAERTSSAPQPSEHGQAEEVGAPDWSRSSSSNTSRSGQSFKAMGPPAVADLQLPPPRSCGTPHGCARV